MRWRIGEGRAVGSFALLVTLLTYASPLGERQLWRWSYVDGGIILLVALILAFTLLGLRAPAIGPIDAGYRPLASRIAAHWIDLAWFLWGLGYLIGSAFLPASRGRLLQLDLFNSNVPGASFLEWSGGVALLVAFGAMIWQPVARRSRVAALLLLLPLVALGAGEGWARWSAIYHPRPTAVPSVASERWAANGPSPDLLDPARERIATNRIPQAAPSTESRPRAAYEQGMNATHQDVRRSRVGHRHCQRCPRSP
jgi:hypothetical protein